MAKKVPRSFASFANVALGSAHSGPGHIKAPDDVGVAPATGHIDTGSVI